MNPRFVIREDMTDATIVDASDPDYAIEQRPIISSDFQSLPADFRLARMQGTRSNRQTIVLRLTMDSGYGLHHEMTSAAARLAAAAMIAHCDKIDAAAAEQAAAALAKAAGK